jgi:HK97 family phage prohead protease
MAKAKLIRAAQQINFTTVTSDGIFTGYPIIWGSVNDRGEAVKRGAFAHLLKDQGRFQNGLIKLLWSHDTEEPIGRILEMREDDKGLWMRGKLNLKVARAKEVLALMQDGDVNGLSIGFDPNESEYVDKAGTLVLTKVDLWEVSIVTLPALEEAMVDGEVKVTDRIVLGDASRVRITNDGYMVAEPLVARTGIQIYRGKELGRPDLDEVRVYRPPEAVFDKRSMASLAHKPITDDHPPVLVNSDNWKKYCVGETEDEVARDGEFIRVPLKICDGEMIKKIRDGKKELSVGYIVAIDWESGTTPSGEAYDAKQTGIRANHIAVVDAARGGAALRIGDNDHSGERNRNMASTILAVDGVNVELSDIASQVVGRAMEKFEKEIAALRSKMTEEEEKKKKAEDALKDAEVKHATEIKTKDAEVETLKKSLADAALTPAKLDEAVKARAGIVDKAKAILGDRLIVDGKTDVEIMRQVVDNHMGDGSKGWDESAVKISFASIKSDPSQMSDTAVIDANRAMGAAFLSPAPTGQRALLDKAYNDRNKSLENAWRNKASA